MKSAAIAAIIVIVMSLLLALQYSRVVSLRGEVEIESKARKEAVAANLESEATITTLRAEAKRNADYQADLNKRLQASQTKARKAEKDFETLKRNSKPVRDWADQPLPDGLRGKATSGDKDKGGSN